MDLEVFLIVITTGDPPLPPPPALFYFIKERILSLATSPAFQIPGAELVGAVGANKQLWRFASRDLCPPPFSLSLFLFPLPICCTSVSGLDKGLPPQINYLHPWTAAAKSINYSHFLCQGKQVQ